MRVTFSKRFIAVLMLLALLAAPRACAEAGEWISLFNGKDLDGWTPKIKGYPLGENFGNTFRVEDGVLKVAYDAYTNFDGKFGHLFYKTPYKAYKIRVEYRFVGDQVPGGPGWATRNSGIMLHCQDPATIELDQDFPVSVEVQLLGGLGKGPRPTCNVCTPGTDVEMNGEPLKPHCFNSKSQTYDGDQWVTAEVEVTADGQIKHFINGELVLEYANPTLDLREEEAKKLHKDGEKAIRSGYISLQSESHPVEFRKVELLPTE